MSDPLLVRAGQKLELTPYAHDLIGPVEAACEALEAVMQAPRFEAAHAQRIFTVAAPDHIAAMVVPPLIKTLRNAAPGITPHFIAFCDNVGQRHRLGDIDLVVMPRLVVDLFGHPELRIVHFYTEEFVHVVRAGHPLASLPFADDSEIRRYPKAIFTPPVPIPEGLGAAYGMLPSRQDSGEDTGMIAGRFEHLGALPMIAAQGDLVVTIPRRQAL